MVALDTSPVTPGQDQLNQTRRRIEAHIESIARHPDRREGAFPYYLLHGVGTPIRGTVLMFHGFSARPHQMAPLADYLYRNGFNVYQATLAGHAYRIPDKYWPQIDLKPEIWHPLREKISADPQLQQDLAEITAAPVATPSPLQMVRIVARLRQLEPRLLDIVAAIERDQDPDFDHYFVGNSMAYLTDAEARLAELDAMPGPIFTVGLSVGGAVALALSAKHPERVAKVVTYAPLLEVYGEDRERYVNLAGPLDIREFGWDDLRFPLGCFTAANRFGAFVRQKDNISALGPTPTLMWLTENEDAADLQTNQAFHRSLGGGFIFRRYNHHYSYTFAAGAKVPHPMVDPQEKSQGMQNAYWQPMYQETYRFLAHGTFDSSSLNSPTAIAELPPVPPIEA
jgi:pimeloyl-ACP methyl ester carboxylesterase